MVPFQVSMGSFHFLLVSIRELSSKNEKGVKRKIIQETRSRPASQAFHTGPCAQKGPCTWFFHGTHYFYFKEQIMDKLWLFRLGYLADIFLKMNKLSLSLQGKEQIVFCLPMTKFQLLSKNQTFGKFRSNTISLMASQLLRPFFNEAFLNVNLINKCDFF